MTDEHAPTQEQLALLRDAARPTARAEEPTSRHQGPVAVVRPLLAVPHLDRDFEYAIPESMAGDVSVGVQVKVRFSGQEVSGYVLAVRDQAEHLGELKPLRRLVSPEPVLTPQTLSLAERVAQFYAGTVADVLRLAVPPRHARAEKALDDRQASAVTAQTTHGPYAPPADGAWSQYGGGLSLLKRLAAGEGPGASWTAAPATFGALGWPAAMAELVEATLASGRGSLIIVPDARDVDRVAAACSERVGPDNVVRLTADQGPQARYTAFLKARRGIARVVVGTRAAMFAPVEDLGLAVWWDDTNPTHADPHAPYPHVREVLRIRTQLSGAALISGGSTRSAAMQAWVESGLLRPVEPLERTSARVVVTGDDRSVERHGPAARARIPAEAWSGLRRALESGPVLVQVPRRGYIPATACARCRTKALCPACHGPLGLDVPDAPPTCRWCGHVAHVFTCDECGGHEVRSLVIGAGRTAEELGRAFPGVPVRRSGAPEVLAEVPDEPSLVISTPGAEPSTPRGYAAVLLLDAWGLLDRSGLAAAERALTQWATAAGMARAAGAGGEVYLAGVPRHVPFPAVEALVRWAPGWFAERELAERAELSLPPSTRMAALEGQRKAAQSMAEEVERAAGEAAVDLLVLGPLPLGRRHAFDRPVSQAEPGETRGDDDPLVRYLVRWENAADLRPVKILHNLRAERSASREPVVTVRLDPPLDGLG